MRAHLLSRPIVIVEDSDEDFEVVVWALRQAGVTNPVHRCTNATGIVELLTHDAHWSCALGSSPAFVLLDLNVPGSDWRDTLGQLRSNPSWCSVPVVIVSTSGAPATVSACYCLGAAGYLQKPLDLVAFAAAIQRLAAYWLDTVVLAGASQPGTLGSHQADHR